MTHLILAAIAGGLIVFLAGSTLYYRAILKSIERDLLEAENERREMVKVANDALTAKHQAEEGFEKAKEYFQMHLKTPVLATITDEQVKNIADYLATHTWNGKIN